MPLASSQRLGKPCCSTSVFLPGVNAERPVRLDRGRTTQVTAAPGASHHPAASASDRLRDAEVLKMPVNERRLQAGSSDRLPSVSENALLATVAIGFLILHILAGTILLQAPAAATATPQQESRPSSFD
jgi:hypothetical protein